MATVVAFGISLGALSLFLVFKVIEHERGFGVYQRFRERADSAVVSFLAHVRARCLSIEEQLSVRNVTNMTLYKVATSVAHTADIVGRHAEDVSRRIARSQNGVVRKTKSSFLLEVETHKRGLDTERVRRETRLSEEE